MNLKNNDKINEKEEYYIIDSKNILKIEDQNDINENISKYFGISSNEINEEDLFNKSTTSSNATSYSNKNIDNNSHKLMKVFIEKLYPNSSNDFFSISKKISSQFYKNNNEDKNRLEQSIDFFYNKKTVFQYTSSINFDFDTIYNLGYILIATYHKLSDYKIYNKKSFRENINKIAKSEQDVLLDFLKYCSQKKYNPSEHKKTSFWEKNSNDYYIPPIFIFLMNTFNKIESININFDLENHEELSLNEYIDFLSICIYNIKKLFKNINEIKMNLIHIKLQCRIYSNYYDKYAKNLKKYYGILKKRYLKLDYIYDNKWDFKTEFLVEEFNKIDKNIKIEKKRSDEIKKKNLSLSKISLSNDEINESKNNLKSRLTAFFFRTKNSEDQDSRLTTVKMAKKNSYENNDKELIKNNEEEELSNNNPDKIYKSIDINNEISYYLKSILLLVNCFKFFSNIIKLELILNDSYLPEFYSFFENEVFDQENKSINLPLLKEFHLIDIISSRFARLTNLNLEINSLDSLTFKKILEGIYNYSSLVSLCISFFSSDVTYLQQNIYRLYISNPPYEDILKKQKWRDDSEFKILDKFLDDFCINLQNLFNLIRIKDLQILGFNFNIPDILLTKQKYSLAIIKFILNVLLLITKKDAIFQKVTILAPKIKFDNEFYPFINKVLGNINPKSNNKIIRELNFQLQLYKIINIKNLISESLVILNIGDCDFYTFEALIQNLTSYRFCINSSLSKLSISLIKSLYILDIKIYNLIFKLFNIKITHLKEVNLYTNLIVKDEKTYIFLLNVFSNNWISLCTLTFNKNSEKMIKSQECESERKRIKYLVPDSLENELLLPEDKEYRRKIFNGQPFKKNDDAFWFLKYIFKIRYKCDEIKDEDENKNKKEYKNKILSKLLTNKILRYLHFEKDIRIEHNLVKYSSQEQ